MPNHPLFLPVADHHPAAPVRDQIQIALAIAEPVLLKSLLTHCVASITQPHLIGSITAEIAVPTQNQQAADGVIHYEAIHCMLAEGNCQESCKSSQGYRRSGDRTSSKSPRWESPSQSLETRLTLPQAMAMLESLGFSGKQVDDILYMPAEAGHKSWWYTLDSEGQFTVPFLRVLRTVRYADGTFTFQYKDYFDQEQPSCFKSLQQHVLVEIKSETETFSETLKRVNHHRSALGINQTVLICNTISELEAQGFMSQGISIYAAIDLILPTIANCQLCGRYDCPMNGNEASQVVMCYGFMIEASRV